MKRTAKGKAGYVKYERFRRLIVMLIMFAIPILIFVSGILYWGKRENILTVVAIVGVLPAARFTVNWIMIMLAAPAPADLVKKTDHAAGDLVHGYELTVTAYEGRMSLDAVVIGKGCVAALTRADKSKVEFMEQHIKESLGNGGHFNMTVKIFTNEKAFLDRVAQMAEKDASPDKDYAVLDSIKDIAL